VKVRYGVQDVVAAVKSGIGNTAPEPEGPARSTAPPRIETNSAYATMAGKRRVNLSIELSANCGFPVPAAERKY
jgi:hypothetical protein